MQFGSTPKFFDAGTRTVAIFEAAKGLLVLIAGLGLLSLVHHDVRRFAIGLVRHLHLSPAGRYSSIFIRAAANLNDARLRLLAMAALFYAAARLIEAYGLWHQRAWAKWLALITGAVYLPVEIYELVERVTSVRVTVFVINLLIVALLSWERLYNARLRPRGNPLEPQFGK